MHLKKYLCTHNTTKGASIKDHLTIFKEIVSDLESMKIKIENEDLALILLCLLPPSYATSVDTMLYYHKEISLEEVYDALFSKEEII